MDQIEFATIPVGDLPASGRQILPMVNRTSLIELAAHAEAEPATVDGRPDLAGNYGPIGPVSIIGWPSRHYLGEPEFSWLEDGDTVLLGCPGCGEWGCWPLTAKVAVTEATVTWSDFRQGHRDWNLSAMGPFTFDRAEYERALRVAARPT